MEVALAARREVQADAVIGIAVAVPVFAVEEGRHGQELLPGRRRVWHRVAHFGLESRLPLRIVQDVVAVVEELRVTVHLRAVGLAAPLKQRAEGGRGVIGRPLREAFVADPLIDRLDPAVAHPVAVLPGRADESIVRVLAGQKVGRDGRAEFVVRHFDDLHARAGRRFEGVAPEIDRAGDAAARPLAEHAERHRLAFAEGTAIGDIGGQQRLEGEPLFLLIGGDVGDGEQLLGSLAKERLLGGDLGDSQRQHGAEHE